MSAYNFDTELPEELVSLRKQLADSECQRATLQGQLLKRNAEFDEMKSTLDDTLYKLRLEADKALGLEKNLNKCSEDLEQQKMFRANAETALLNAQGQIKEREREAKESQAMMHGLTARVDELSRRESELACENTKFERRTRDLETNYQNAVATTATATSSAPKRRPRASSLTDLNTTLMEQELKDLRAARVDNESKLASLSNDLRRAQNELFAVQNEKIALERRLQVRIEELESSVAEKDEELKAQQGESDAVEREMQLLERLEQEEAQVATLQGMVDELQVAQKQLQKTEKKLNAEVKKVIEAERKQIELEQQQEQAIHELDAAKDEIDRLNALVLEREDTIETLNAKERELTARVSSLSMPPPTAPASASVPGEVVERMETFMKSISRLRAERDGLRLEKNNMERDLAFLQAEHKFTVDALNSSKGGPPPPPAEDIEQAKALQEEVARLRDQIAEATSRHEEALREKDAHMRRIELAAAASAVVISRLASDMEVIQHQNQEVASQLEQVHAELAEAVDYRESAERTAVRLQDKLHDFERDLNATVEELNHIQHERDQLLGELAQLEQRGNDPGMDDELRETLAETEAQLQEMFRSFEWLASERDTLANEVMNMESELTQTKQDFDDAEKRYQALQQQQLSELSHSQTTSTLRERVEELEGRILRRTEQIGVHQHDIRRLETNLRLLEDRLQESGADLETLTAQKEALVEDCAATRRERAVAEAAANELQMQLFDMESRSEAVEREREREVGAVVRAWSDIMLRVRTRPEGPRSAAPAAPMQVVPQNAAPAPTPTVIEHTGSDESDELAKLRLERERIQEMLDGRRSSAIRSFDASSATLVDRVRQVSQAFATSQRELESRSRSVEDLQATLARAEGQVRSLQEELESKEHELTTLIKDFDSAEHHHNEELTQADYQIAELEAKLQDLQQMHNDMKADYDRNIDDLVHSQEQLEARLSETAQGAEDVEAFKEELEHVQAEHAEELAQLQQEHEHIQVERSEELGKVRRQLEDTTKELETVKAARDEFETRYKDAIDGQTKIREELDGRIASAEDRLRLAEGTERELEELRKAHNEALKDSEERLEQAEAKAEEVAKARDELDGLYQQTRDELVQVNEDHEWRLNEALRKCEDLQKTVERLTKEQLTLEEELESTRVKYGDLETSEGNLREELASNQTELEEARKQVRALTEESHHLKIEMTNLKAEIQKSLSLRRYMESQIKEHERSVTSLTEQLQETRAALGRSEHAATSAKVSLALQAKGHEQVVAELQREVTNLQSKATLEERVAELQEKIDEMDEMLRNKTSEIEENDDKFIEVLKENKKLNTKAETLRRKLHTLQNKLAAAPTGTSPVTASAPSSSAQPRLSRSAAPPVAGPSNAPPAPSTPSRRSTHNRTPSGPSNLYRPKTPELKSTQAAIRRPKTPDTARKSVEPSSTSVSQAKTPEASTSQPTFRRIKTSVRSGAASQTRSALESSTESVAGQKRRVPDDFDDGSSMPAQGVVAERHGMPRLAMDNATPRSSRRILQANHTGFTPKRGATAQSMSTQPSPVKRVAADVPEPPIYDVTNSPRKPQHLEAAPVKTGKKSWLGKIRSNPAQSRFTSQSSSESRDAS